MVSRLTQLLCKMQLLMCLISLTQAATAADLKQCVGKICIGENALTYRQLKAKFHVLRIKHNMGSEWDRSLCILDRKAGVSMVLLFSGDTNLEEKKLDGLFLTKRILCEDRKQPLYSLPLRTEEAFQIGKTKQMVLKKLGPPSRIDNALEREKNDSRYSNTREGSIYGAYRLHYENGAESLLFNEFGIDENGVIVSIWLNESP